MKLISNRIITALAIICMLGLASAGCRAASVQKDVSQIVKAYEYDHSKPLDAEVTPVNQNGGISIYHVLYNSESGERVPALMYLPQKPAAPMPCIIVLHGYGGSKDMGGPFATFMVPRGYAIFAIDIEYHGERKENGKDVLAPDADDDVAALQRTVFDLMRGVDYLQSRGDIDMNKIGYIGTSLGALMGAVFTGLEPRVDSVLLIVGGGDWDRFFEISQVPPFGVVRDIYAKSGKPLTEFSSKFAPVEPLNFAGMISPRPLMMVNCSNDKYVPKETAEKLFAVARDPKEIKWYECSGDIAHIPPMDKTLDVMKKWFKKTLGK